MFHKCMPSLSSSLIKKKNRVKPTINMSFSSFRVFSIFFLFSIPSTFSLSFNFPSFGPNENKRFINPTGDAYISTEDIQLTPNERGVSRGDSVGRATYTESLHLWDKASGNLSDFSTHFSFVIDSEGNYNFGDGITFFFAPVGSTIKSTARGGSIGLNTDNSFANSSAESFFAVEFDTYPNDFDPRFTPLYTPHVGININSMRSIATERWLNNITQGVKAEAWISYNGSSKMLTVNFTGFWNNRTTWGNLSSVVDLRNYMPEFVTFGFSGATGSSFEKNSVTSWEFSSNLQLITISPEEPTPSPLPETQITVGGGKRNWTGLAIGLGVGLPIMFLLFGGYCFWKKKHKKGGSEDAYILDPSMDTEFEKGSGAKKFSYNELARATENFSEDFKLGEGGFGGVYRGFLKDSNSYIAVKRVSRGSKQGLKEYASEVKIISQLRHRNLVQLIGWCHERGELVLVYEFLPNGSLDSHIFKQNSVLTWDIRFKIAQGLASALLYLHEEWEQCVVHRDIKSSNIMLDSNFNAKLGDFGLARLVDHEKGSQTTILAGTMGYMAPECAIEGRASKESDVYSFGVVLLEIGCGRRSIDTRAQENQVRLVEMVWNLYGMEKIVNAADKKLGMEYDAREMEQLLIVGLWCVHPDNRYRPSIRQAMTVLNFEAQLPELPKVMPVPTYYNSPPTINLNSIGNTNSSGTVTDSSAYSHYSDSSILTSSSSAANSDPAAALLKS